MRQFAEPDGSATQRDLVPAALIIWATIATVGVVLLFPVLHSRMNHALAIIASGACGAALGAVGYAATNAFQFRRGAALAGALGGAIGVLALHVLPLLH